MLALASYVAGLYDGVISAFNKMTTPYVWSHAYLAASYAQMGRMDNARVELDHFVQARERQLSQVSGSAPLEPIDLVQYELDLYVNQADRSHFLEGLRKAGLAV